MAVDGKLDQLSRQLSKQSLGPIDTILNQIMSRFVSASASLVVWLQQAAWNQPLITLLLSCQIGYLIARLGRRR